VILYCLNILKNELRTAIFLIFTTLYPIKLDILSLQRQSAAVLKFQKE